MKAEILKKLKVEPSGDEAFEIFLSSLKAISEYADFDEIASWNAPVLHNLSKLAPDEIKFIKEEMKKARLSIKESQVRVQKLIPKEKRKRFASYYSVEQATNLMASIVEKYMQSKNEKITLADPFLGSALTLTATIEKIGAEKIQKVWGIEPLTLPALVSYASLLKAMNGKKDAINVIVGDAFEEISKAFSPLFQLQPLKADIILTNPPFTRWEYLDERYREFVISVIERLGYKKYLTKNTAGLQALSMLLCDYILNDKGLLVSVLPASMFYTLYGRGYKALLRERYGLYAVIEPKTRVSFSKDSGIKEVITVAVKEHSKRPTMFIEMDDNAVDIASIIMNKDIKLVDIHNVPKFLDINWLAFFEDTELGDSIINIFEQGLKNGKLGYWEDILGKGSLVKGIEMYGPNFFFIPNKYWNIKGEDANHIIIRNESKELAIGKEFLIKTLRKPSFYSNKIVADVDTYMLLIPPVGIARFPNDLQEYIKWGASSGTAKPSINSYGRYWYSHVYKQIKAKSPIGHVFLPDKTDLLFRSRGVFANYTEEKTLASENFFVVKIQNEPLAKLLVGWFNSSIYISILALLGRKISNTWTRFLESEYYGLPLINLKNAENDEEALEIIKAISRMLNEPLPPLFEQLDKDYRYNLDLAIAKFIGINNPEDTIRNLYKILNNLSRKLEACKS